jgi:hypothetical protein
MLKVVILSVVILSGIMQRFVILSVIMLCHNAEFHYVVIMLTVVMLRIAFKVLLF